MEELSPELIAIIESEEFAELCDLTDWVEYYLVETKRELIQRHGGYRGRESWVPFEATLTLENERVVVNTLQHDREVACCEIQSHSGKRYLVMNYHR